MGKINQNIKTSLKQLAHELNLSPSTVSRALNNSDKISDATKLRVEEMAKKLNYVPNESARTLKSGQNKTIGVIVPNIARHFFSSVIDSIEEYASANGYDVLISQTKDSYEIEERIVKNIERRVDGVIISIAAHGKGYNYLNDLRIPIVLFDRQAERLNSASVTIDDEYGGYIATKHLLDQGFRKIYNITGLSQISIWRDRHQGYLRAMKEAGINVMKYWIWESPTTLEEGEKFAQHILTNSSIEVPDALFSNGDYAAIGFMKEMQRNGYKIPVIGFSNEPLCELVTPTLSSVNQYCSQIGVLSCKLLLDLINGSPISKSIITPELIIRESSINK